MSLTKATRGSSTAMRGSSKAAGPSECANVKGMRDVPAARGFVSLDERLRTAAILEGFQVLPTAV